MIRPKPLTSGVLVGSLMGRLGSVRVRKVIALLASRSKNGGNFRNWITSTPVLPYCGYYFADLCGFIGKLEP